MKSSIRLVLTLTSFALVATAAAPLHATARAPRPAAPTPIPCRPWSYDAESFRLFITDLDTSTTDSARTYRRFWSIPVVTPADIELIRDDSLCDRTARIHAEAVKSLRVEPYPVFVLRVGRTRYIVFNFMSVGEWHNYTILDSALRVVAVRRS